MHLLYRGSTRSVDFRGSEEKIIVKKHELFLTSIRFILTDELLRLNRIMVDSCSFFIF